MCVDIKISVVESCSSWIINEQTLHRNLNLSIITRRAYYWLWYSIVAVECRRSMKLKRNLLYKEYVVYFLKPGSSSEFLLLLGSTPCHCFLSSWSRSTEEYSPEKWHYLTFQMCVQRGANRLLDNPTRAKIYYTSVKSSSCSWAGSNILWLFCASAKIYRRCLWAPEMPQ